MTAKVKIKTDDKTYNFTAEEKFIKNTGKMIKETPEGPIEVPTDARYEKHLFTELTNEKILRRAAEGEVVSISINNGDFEPALMTINDDDESVFVELGNMVINADGSLVEYDEVTGDRICNCDNCRCDRENQGEDEIEEDELN